MVGFTKPIHMSSYVVSTETIDKILNHLNRDHSKMLGCALRRQKDADGLYYSFDDTNSLTRLGNAMLTMNELGTATRYRETPVVRTDYVFKLGFLKAGETPAAAYKALQCFLYQCAESEAIVTSELYQALEKLLADIAYEIISATGPYHMATWG